MPYTSTYPMSSFANGMVNLAKLEEEINDTNLTVTLQSVAQTNGVSCELTFDVQPSSDDVAELDIVVARHEGEPIDFIEAPTYPSILGAAVALVRKQLIDNADYTPQQIDTGLLVDHIYDSVDDLPQPPLSDPTTPAFAIMRGTPYQVAMWDHGNQTGWVLTNQPWWNAIVTPEWSIHLDNSIGGTGTGAGWQYCLGTEYRINEDCILDRVAFKSNQNGNQNHAWAIRRARNNNGNIITSNSQPNLNRYTEIMDSGTFPMTGSDQWHELILDVPLQLGENQWVVVHYYAGDTSGVSRPLSQLRNANQVTENIVTINSGCFVHIGGSNPGATAIPTNRVNGTLYGLCSARFAV